jgi:hypothetical protein
MLPTHPRRRPWPTVLLLVLTALLLALAAVVLVAPPVRAGALGGAEPSNYRTRVLAVRPPVPGLSVEVVDAGTRLRLANGGPDDVVVLGYRSEPWLRVPPGGVVTWQDRRARWEAEEPPAQVRRAPGSAHVVIPEWIVPLRTGGQLVEVVGEVRWVPGPSPLPWLAGAAVLAMAVAAVGRARRWVGGLVAALGLVVALDLVQVAGAWAGAEAPPAGALPPLAASAAGWVVAGLAVRQLLRGRLESGLFQLLLAAGLLTVVGGLGDLGFLLRSELPNGLPGWVARAAVTAKIGLGLGALVAAGLRLSQLRLLGQPASGLPEDLDPSFDLDVDPDPFEPAELAPAGARRLHVVGGRVAGGDDGVDGERATPPAGATVLPWPGTRRPGGGFFDDPDLPGGA